MLAKMRIGLLLSDAVAVPGGLAITVAAPAAPICSGYCKAGPP
jgi:hypothetical protein